MRRRYRKRKLLVFIESFIVAIFCMLLVVPLVGENFGNENSYYEVNLEGVTVGSVKDPSVVEQAFLDARARISRETDGLVLSDVECTTTQVQKMVGSTMDVESLSEAIYQELQKDVTTAKKKGYLIKINEFTLTVSSYQDVLDILNATKDKYDEENEFEVNIVLEADRELNVYTAEVGKRPAVEEGVSDEEVPKREVPEYTFGSGIGGYDLSPLLNDIVTATVTEETIAEETEGTEEETEEREVTGDGLKAVAFAEKVEIVEAYVGEDQLTSVEDAINMVTKDTEKNQVYEVKPGDTLSVIANSHGLYVADVVALNDGLSADTVLHIGDEIIITVPEPELSVETVEELTYEEDYFAEPEVILNDEWYTNQTVVHQEEQAGHHVITTLISKKNSAETGREMIAETVTVEPVQKVIEKGTKTPPTYIKPISGGRQTSKFGPRKAPTKGASTYHKGIDWATPVGTAVMASCGGTVIQAGWSSGYGYCITLSHPDGKKTRYGHLSKILVSSGQKVSQGQKIALSGNTGRSTGPHLHFEIHVNGVQVNPYKYLQ